MKIKKKKNVAEYPYMLGAKKINQTYKNLNLQNDL